MLLPKDDRGPGKEPATDGGDRRNHFGLADAFSQIFKPEMTSIPYGHNEHSLLRHHIRPRLHDRPHHHEDHARLLGKAQGLPED
jgi:hypothetical protein